jgi:uncharacterized protein (TIGR03435 family)
VKNRLLCVAVLAYAPAVKAQDPRPKFELASIKECKNTDRPPPSTNSPGRLSLSCWQLKRLILQAYEVFADGKVDPLNPYLPTLPMEGDPAWVSSTSYSIDAKAETPQSPAMMMGPMMQTLLEERFQLKLHHETRDGPVYFMTVAKGGLRLQPSKEGSCIHIDPTDFAQPPLPPGGNPCALTRGSRNGPMVVTDIYGVTLDVFARIMHPGGRHVIDRTGVTGTFDIHLEREPASPSPDGGASDPGIPEIAAMREQLGLRLDPGRGPSEFLIVDRIERPSGN